jgi:sulfhydrogenase subunit alpha
VRWVAAFPFPQFERDYEFVALRHPDEYPFNEGRLVSNRDIDIDIADYETQFEERHVAHSTALHSLLKRRGAYLVGPLARYALNFDRLPASVQALAREVRARSGVPQSFPEHHRARARDRLRLRGGAQADRSL